MARTINHPALQPLKAKFPGSKFLVGEFRDMVTVVVPRDAIVPVCTFLRDDPALRDEQPLDAKGLRMPPDEIDEISEPFGNSVHQFRSS